MSNRVFTVPANGTAAENGRSLLQTIERCREAGGGVVEVPDGSYEVASIRLYSDMTLHLSGSTRIIASTDWRAYTDFHVPTSIRYIDSERIVKLWNLPPHYFNAVINVIGEKHVAIIGEPGSLIDGCNCFDPNGEEKFRGPMGMVICKCSDVTLRGYTFQNSSNWSHQIDACINVNIDHVTCLAGHDGFNVHHCENVRISNCEIRTGDDCIAGYDARNVYITGCYMNTSCNGFRFGGENLVVEGCVFEGPGEYPHRVSGRHNMLYAFEYYSLEDDVIRDNSRNWVIKDCIFRNMDGFIHYDFGNMEDHQTNRPLENILVQNFEMSGMKKSSVFRGGTGTHAVLTLRNGTIDMNRMEEPDFAKTDENSSIIMEKVSILCDTKE